MLHEALDLINTAAIIDLFASRTNHQFSTYVFFQSDPTARFIDAFSIDWSSHIVYISAFQSPLKGAEKNPDRQGGKDRGGTSLEKTDVLANAHRQVNNDTSTTVVPRLLPSDKTQKHPLRNKLDSLVCRVSRDDSKRLDFLETLPALSCRHGDLIPKEGMTCTCGSGKGTRVSGGWFQFHPYSRGSQRSGNTGATQGLFERCVRRAVSA